MKFLYDSFFKEILNPEYAPERLEELLSLLLGVNVKILEALPADSTRIAEESSLLIMDIVVQLGNGAIVNLEVQKIGYKFPGERSACYSADLLLRQYKRVRSEKSTGNRILVIRILKEFTRLFFSRKWPHTDGLYSAGKIYAGVQSTYWEILKPSVWNSARTEMPKYSVLEAVLENQANFNQKEDMTKHILNRCWALAAEIQKYLEIYCE